MLPRVFRCWESVSATVSLHHRGQRVLVAPAGGAQLGGVLGFYMMLIPLTMLFNLQSVFFMHRLDEGPVHRGAFMYVATYTYTCVVQELYACPDIHMQGKCRHLEAVLLSWNGHRSETGVYTPSCKFVCSTIGFRFRLY